MSRLLLIVVLVCGFGAEAVWMHYALTYSSVADAHAAVGLAFVINGVVAALGLLALSESR